ncbi:MAG TPA: SGNH/GDSL hydrolase family protein [Pirellulaceae bacterium]|jgi:lysophospholipase L1-like esterase|nr:SGNH/GDSL hydrolase family protein [Pirellulaceae bacterium]
MPRRASFRLFVLGCVLSLAPAAFAEDFAVRDGDVVGFLGDSITAERTYGKLIENYTLLRFPEREVRFLNLGIGGDTAAGGLTRLERDVFGRGVTLLTVAYGINDIGWGTKADDEHRQRYLDSIREIVRACRERGVRVYICSAAVTAADPEKSENDYLQQMCDAGLAVAREEGAGTIDVQRTMREAQRRIKAANAAVPPERHETLHAPDGIHLNEIGQLAMTYAILKGLGAPEEVSSCTIDAAGEQVVETRGCSVGEISKIERGVRFVRLDEGLPFNNGAFAALSYRFVPIPKINAYRLKVTNLAPGTYDLVVDGRAVGSYGADALSAGVDIASATADGWQPGGPWDAQATMLKSLTEARHELDLALQSGERTLPESELLPAVQKETDAANARLEGMQRLVAKPRPYEFVLTRRDQ